MDPRKLYEERMAAVAALRDLDAEIGEREPSAEEAAKLAEMHADIDARDAAIERAFSARDLEARSAELAEVFGAEKREDAAPAQTPERDMRALAALNPGEGIDLPFERRDLLAGTATDGAELVPTTLFGQLYDGLQADGTSMFSHGRVIQTASGEAIDMPTVTSRSTAALVTEAGAIGESDPQFGTVTLNAYKYGLAIQISSELLADEAVPGAIPWVVSQAVDGIRRGVGAALVTADGSSKPNGVDNGSTTSTATGVTYPTTDNLVAAYHDIVAAYRANGVWIFNDDTVQGIRLLKDTTNQYLWQPGLQAGAPDRLLGKPVYTDSAFATIGANAKLGVFGDLKRGYVVRIAGGIRAERSVEYAFLNDLVTYRFLGRFDGEIIDNNAYTVITNQAS